MGKAVVMVLTPAAARYRSDMFSVNMYPSLPVSEEVTQAIWRRFRGRPLSTALNRRFSFQTRSNALEKPRRVRTVHLGFGGLVVVTDCMCDSQNVILEEATGFETL